MQNSEVIDYMRKKFILAIAVLLSVTMLLSSGCSDIVKTASTAKGGNISSSVSDNDLINSDRQDSSPQLDSIDDQVQDLSQDELNSLLNDNSDLNNIPSSIDLK